MQQATSQTLSRAHLVRPRLKRRRNRGVWALAILFAIAAGLLIAWKIYNRPVQLRAAVVEESTGDVAVLNAYARYFAQPQNRVGLRMSVQVYKTRGEVSQAFLDGKADLAVVRAEANLRGRASVIAVMSKTIGLVTSLNAKLTEIADMRAKRVALYSPDGSADSFFSALLQTYELKDSDIALVSATHESLPKLAAEKKIDFIVGAAPLVQRRSTEAFRAMLRQKKIAISLLAIERADELVRRSPAFEEFDIPEKSFGDIPESETKSVAMPTNLVAQSTMPNEVAAALARQFLSNKQAVSADAPAVAQISAPSTDKDAFMRVHPGVAAYIDNEEQTFFDKFGDLLYLGAMVGGVLASGFVALRRSFRPDTNADACDLIDDFVELRREARDLPLHVDQPDFAVRWRHLSDSFEEKLALALPLIADGDVEDRTVQALSTALTAAERAIADVGPLAFGYPGARRDGVVLAGALRDGNSLGQALADM